MKRVVAIDGHNLALQRGTGVATYARNLANNLAEMGWDVSTLYGTPVSSKTAPLLREVQFFDSLGGAGFGQSKLSVVRNWAKEIVASPFGYRAAEILPSGSVETRRFADRLPTNAAILNVRSLFDIARRHFRRHGKFLEVRFPGKIDVMHWTYPLPVKVANVPNIYTIHDLVPLRLPYTTLDNKRYYYRLIKGCIGNGDHICTVSERSKDDIVDLFDVPPDDVTNTYQAVDAISWGAQKTQTEAEAEVKGVFGLEPRDYFLFFGAIEPKKNVGRLIEAFLSSHVDSCLVVVGSLAWKADEEMKLVNAMLKQRPELRRRIRLFDYTSRPFLISLIRAAKAVVFPSLYEGFGLPILEAMQLGTPTLCSSGGSLPEIAGDASVCVDPYDVGDIARGLRILDQDEQLRKHLALAGVERAKVFSADAYKTRLLQMYGRII
ncbi:glycosyltransferase family 4 protein [Paraburkholderia sp. RCC_158]|uniref:glycosyltransferase family 4 protein n=1 Tax=Paraburkholderia sp. RCC_158 TaxID=3239220 RepID=UPI0035243359